MTTHVNLLSSADAAEIPAPNFPYQNILVPENVHHAGNWADLVRYANDDKIEIALWERQSLPALSVISNTAASEFEILFGEYQDILTGFNALYETSTWPESLREIVEQDAHYFLQACETQLPDSQYRMRLQAVSDDACRKFHQDRVFQRLILTYRGDGTIWRHVNDTCCEQNAKAMDCVLLRGKRGDQDAKIQHKSPMFVEGQPPRLIMVIDVIPSL